MMTKDIIYTDHSNQFINAYLRDARRYKTLSRDEELQLLRQASMGDESARELLVKHNLLFAVSVAKKYKYPNVPIEDLIQASCCGLYEATFRFDYSRSVRFLTYAFHYMRAKIQETIQEYRLVKQPDNNKEMITSLQYNVELDKPVNGENGATLADYLAGDNDLGYINESGTEERLRRILGVYADMFIYYASLIEQDDAIQLTANKFNISAHEAKLVIERSRSKLQKVYKPALRSAA